MLDEYSYATSCDMDFYSMVRMRIILSSPALCFLAGFSSLAECLPRSTSSLRDDLRVSLVASRGHREPLNTPRD